MKEVVLVMVGLAVGAAAVIGGLGLAALVLWWTGVEDEAVPITNETRQAERRITEINRRARDWIVTDLLNRVGSQTDDVVNRTRERYERTVDGEWR